MMQFLNPLLHILQDFFHKKRQFLVIAIPYVWLFLFFFMPFLFILKISFSKAQLHIPPFTELVHWVNQWAFQIHLDFSKYAHLFQDDLYLTTSITSLRIALISALSALVIGFSMAYGIYRAPRSWKVPLLLLVILPFWTSFLVRVYAWMSLLSTTGLVNSFLLSCHLIQKPLRLLDNDYAVCVGIVYCYLPFMIFPIYNHLERIDHSLIEASFDLGATPFRTFCRIIIPLCFPGILTGFTLVFIPALGEFVIPELLGSPDTLMIGRTLWYEFFNNRDWPQACALAVTLIIFIILPIMLFQSKKIQSVA